MFYSCRSEEDDVSQGTGDTNYCQPFNIGPGNRTRVFFKSNKFLKLLIHLFSPDIKN